MEAKAIISHYTNSSPEEKKNDHKTSYDIYMEYMLSLSTDKQAGSQSNLSLVPNDNNEIVYIETKSYSQFMEYSNYMHKKKWVPCSKVLIKTDKFYQEFTKIK